jgi:membrane-associated protease RseP (regulator of RpoE activity)
VVGTNAVAARAEEPACGDVAIGVVSATDVGLRVGAPAVAALRPGDVLLQLNGHRLRACDDLRRAIAEARAGGLEVLLLVEREGQASALRIDLPEPLAVAGAVPAAEPAADEVPLRAPTIVAVVPPTPTRQPSPTPSLPPTAVPTPASSADAALVREALAEANAFGRELQDSLPLPSSQPWLDELRRLRDAQARRRASSAAVAVLEPILAYYETVGEILVYKEEITRDDGRRRNRLELVLEYDSASSEVNRWLARYPFLAESVIEPPAEIRIIARGERPGRWLPNRAIELLVERALKEGGG